LIFRTPAVVKKSPEINLITPGVIPTTPRVIPTTPGVIQISPKFLKKSPRIFLKTLGMDFFIPPKNIFFEAFLKISATFVYKNSSYKYKKTWISYFF
jgi:hypothetical protein